MLEVYGLDKMLREDFVPGATFHLNNHTTGEKLRNQLVTMGYDVFYRPATALREGSAEGILAQEYMRRSLVVIDYNGCEPTGRDIDVAVNETLRIMHGLPERIRLLLLNFDHGTSPQRHQVRNRTIPITNEILEHNAI